MEDVGYRELGLKLISRVRIYPIGGISSAPVKKLMTVPKVTLPAWNDDIIILYLNIILMHLSMKSPLIPLPVRSGGLTRGLIRGTLQG